MMAVARITTTASVVARAMISADIIDLVSIQDEVELRTHVFAGSGCLVLV
jgi:hypothetical protein